MTTALKFATVRKGKIVAINDAYPPHELNLNQFEITDEEFALLKSITPKNNEDILDVIISLCFFLGEKVDQCKK